MGQITELDHLADTLRAALDVDFTEQPSSVLRDAVSELTRLADRLAALDAKAVAAFDASREWTADGHRTAAVGVRCASNQAHPTARRRVTRARQLRDLDHLAGALSAGEVTTDALDAVLRVDTPKMHDALLRDEKELVEAARDLEYVDLVSRLRTWCDLNDPDEADRAANRRDDERSLHASTTLGGQVRLDGWLTPIEGAEVRAELQRQEHKLFEADWAEARDRLGDRATKDDLRRTPAQRRHDALVEMARRSAAYTGDGPAPRGRAVVNLLMDYGTFCAEMARHTGQPFTYPQNRTCELDDGTVVTPSEALNVALAGEVRRIVFGADGHILDFGRSRRLFTPALAEAIAIRDRRCAHDGCLLPASMCETDHVVEWQHQGQTAERNGEPRCRFHHLWKTNNPRRWRELRARRRPPAQE